MTPETGDLRVTDASSASIESGMAPSVMKAWQTGGDLFRVIVPVDPPTARLPTIIGAGGAEHFVPGGRTAVKIVGDFFVNETREFVVDGTVPMPPGPVVFKLLDSGHWEPVLVYGRTRARARSQRVRRQGTSTSR
ncbi:hypothetical protein [Curtobacterium sp. ME26]|uniref:hypothetical protein n=1 Tax=Curtobacterium sp. ME26 TaxID=2744254 RepID=UPI0015F4F2DD|nr:hypothetical protein [Curtobacterium sp. ME26]